MPTRSREDESSTLTDLGLDERATGSPARPRARRAVTAAVAALAAVVLAVAAALVLLPGGEDEPTATPAAELPVDDPRLAWAPPALTDPTTVVVTDENNQPSLEAGRDYRLVLPEPITAEGGLIVKGGRNVVIIGGEIEVPTRDDVRESVGRRGLYLTEQTGTVHVEGLHIRGEDLSEGINIDQRDGAVVQLQNIRVEAVQGSEDGHHADIVQTWAGPDALRVDRFTGFTTYQGFFLLPTQRHDPDDTPQVDLRRVDLHGDDDSEYLLWQTRDGDLDLELAHVWVESEAWDELSRYVRPVEDWGDVRAGTPPGGEFVPADSVGTDYVSPGYLP